jgi:methionine-rich copper-binding protein CopC
MYMQKEERTLVSLPSQRFAPATVSLPTPQFSVPIFRYLLRVRSKAISAALISFIFTLLGFSPASAHAELVSSTPAAGSVIQTSESFELRWNEVVQTGEAQIRLLDTSGTATKIAVKVNIVDNMTVAVIRSVKPITEGSWVITWKVVSADGHLISGAIPFTFIKETPTPTESDGPFSTKIGEHAIDHGKHHPEILASTPLRSDGPLDRTTEAISWLAVLVAAGALIGLRRGFATAAGVVAFTLGSSRAAQISIDFGGPLVTTGESRAAALVALSGAVLVFTSSVWNYFSSRATACFVAISLVIFSMQSLFSGHHLDLEGTSRVVATFAHSAHLLAMAVWVSAVIAAAMNPTQRQLQLTRRFSTISLPVLIVAGSTLSYLLIFPTSIFSNGLFSTTAFNGGVSWLSIFAATRALRFLAVILGWVKHRRSAKNRENSTALVSWRRSLGTEIALFVFIAAVSATLTLNSPPTVAHPTTDAKNISASNPSNDSEHSSGDDSDTTATSSSMDFLTVGGYRATLTVESLNAGKSSSWELKLVSSEGKNVDVDKVILEASNTAADLEGVDVVLEPLGEGRYKATHALPVAGIWQIHLSFLLDQFTLEHAVGILEALNTSTTPTTNSQKD